MTAFEVFAIVIVVLAVGTNVHVTGTHGTVLVVRRE